MISSKDLARIIEYKSILANRSSVYWISSCSVVAGFIILEICCHCIRAIYMELMLDRCRRTYDTTAVQCFNLFRGAGMIAGFFIGSQLLDPNTCKFWYQPLIVFLVFYIFTYACTLISIKSNKTLLTETTPLEPSSSSINNFSFESEPTADLETLKECYTNHVNTIGNALKATPLFLFVQVLAWWSLMNFLYFFAHIQTSMSKNNISYLIALTKDAHELMCISYMTAAFGLSIYAFSFCCYCAGIKKLRKYLSKY